MKKFLSIAVLLFMLAASVLPASAAEPVSAALNANVTLAFGLDTAYKSYNPAKVFDGNVTYFDGNFADFRLTVGQDVINDGTAPRYNIMGETDKDDSIYLAGFQAEMTEAATVGSIQYWDCGGDDRKYNIDGFDVWVSETGEAGSWTKVASTSKLHTGGKYTVDSSTGSEISTITVEFTPVKAKYIAFGLTEPRAEQPKYAHYFRITELALYAAEEAVTTAPETTAAPETTTAAPVTTAAPETTTAPAATPATADHAPLFAMAALLMAATLLMCRRKYN